jgi:hypothetical protein
MEDGAKRSDWCRGELKHTDLEWFELSERNTLHPLFLYCSRESLCTKLEYAYVCVAWE